MSLSVLGTAANVFGVITPAKDLGEIIKGITNSFQEVKVNEASIVYFSKTLKAHASKVFSLIVRCTDAGANDLQTEPLRELLQSLVQLQGDVIGNSRRPYLIKWWTSGDIRRKMKSVEKRMRHCQDLFVVDTLSTHTGMLMQVNKEVREIANGEGRNYLVERTTIRWKVPGKPDSRDPMVVEYAYLAKKSHTLIFELKSNSDYIHDQLLKSDSNIEMSNFVNVCYPEGSPLSELDGAACRTIRAFETLQARNFSDASFIKWLIDNGRLSSSLYNVGLKKEARQIEEFTCQIWLFLASRRGTAPIYSRLAFSLRNLAVLYSEEGRDAEALSHVEQAIRIYRSLGDSFLPDLAQCLSDRLRSLRCLGRFEESLESAEESVGIWRRLMGDGLSLYGPDLVISLMRQADTLYHLSRHEEALRCSQEALQLLSKVSPRYKQVYPARYAHVFWLIALSHHDLGDHEQAEEYGRRALSVSHALVRDRPLVYSRHLSYTLLYSSWSEHQSTLSVLDESLTVCLTVDTTFIAPQLADILDRRAAVLISSSRYAEALDSYTQAIDVRRRLLEDDEGGGSRHFTALLQSFRLHASCLLSLHRQRDALSSLDAAQDTIVSRMKTEIDETIWFIITELQKEREVVEGCTGPDCNELISSLTSCKKVLSEIQEVKCASQIGSTVRSDLGRLSILEHYIHMMVGSLDLALLSIQDAVDFYRSQIKQNKTRSIQADLVTSLVLHTRCCIRLDRLEQALCSMNDAVNQLRVDLEHDVEGSVSHFFEIFDLYSDISNRFLDEKDCRQGLCMFLEAAIGILRSAVMTSEARTRTALAWLLDDRAHLLYQIKSYQEAMSSSEESVSIYRILVAEDVEMHQWTFAWCLQLFAKALLANGNNNAALSSIEEAVDIQQHFEDKDPKGAGNLRRSISLRAEILYRTGGAADVKDSLSVMWPLEIPNPSKSENAQS